MSELVFQSKGPTEENGYSWTDVEVHGLEKALARVFGWPTPTMQETVERIERKKEN